jgi:hypothetical protein
METLIGTLEYRGYSIEQDTTLHPDRIIIYPTLAGIEHDHDYNGSSYTYCGNCKWADSVEEAKEIIDEMSCSNLSVSCRPCETLP